jgi:hypothetical protein
MRAPQTAFREAIAARLANVAPTVFGMVERASADHWPRYSWRTVDSADAKRNRPVVNGGAFEFIGTEETTFEVEVWGKTEEDAWIMRLLLFKAMNQECENGGWKWGRTAVIEPPVVDDGYALLVTLSVFLMVPDVDIPAAPIDGNTAAGTEKVEHPEVEILGWALDPTGAVTGDGTLTGGEG